MSNYRQVVPEHEPTVLVAVICLSGLLSGQAPALAESSTLADEAVAAAPVVACAHLLTLSLPAGGHVTNATDVPTMGSTRNAISP